MAGKIDGSFFLEKLRHSLMEGKPAGKGLSSSPGCQAHSTLQHL